MATLFNGWGTSWGSAWGPLAFVAVYLVRPLIFFSAAVLTVAGGFLFGPVCPIYGFGASFVIIAASVLPKGSQDTIW